MDWWWWRVLRGVMLQSFGEDAQVAECTAGAPTRSVGFEEGGCAEGGGEVALVEVVLYSLDQGREGPGWFVGGEEVWEGGDEAV